MTGTVKLWDPVTGALLANLTGHTGWVRSVQFSPDGRTLAYTSGDASVVLWDATRRTVTARLTGHTQRVHAIAFSPDGTTLATGGADQPQISWDVDPERAISHICTAVARDLTEDEWRHHLPSTPYARTCAQPVG